jgi:transcriptional regulator with XRE-family HTH domain
MTKLTTLRLTRLQEGMSQHEVEMKTGIHQALLSLYERELRTPNDTHKETLAKLYSKKIEELWE